MKTVDAMIPGSFDPPTNGHIDIITRASALFDSVRVVVAQNSAKNAIFTSEERRALLEDCLKHLKNVVVDTTDSLVALYAKEHNIDTIVRGVRNSSDYDYESEIALTNRILNGDLEIVFLPAKEQYRVIRSSIVRELAFHGHDVSFFVPQSVNIAMKEKFKKGDK